MRTTSRSATARPTVEHHDAIVVGARAAGAATAMLLARHGRDVLVLDRAPAGSDTTSTHALMKGGVLQLHRWGLLDAVRAAGTPALRHTVVHYADATIDLPMDGDGVVDALYAPRRTVLDPMLAEAAADAGADVRFDTSVTGLVQEHDDRVVGVTYRTPGGTLVQARAPITIGADGVRSMVARSVEAPTTRTGANASAVAYAYFEGEPLDGFLWFFRDGAGAGVIPTNDGLLAYIALPAGRFDRELRADVEAGFWRLLRRHAPEAAARVTPGGRTSRFHVHAGVAGYHRRPFGPGWALVGDASHFKDPISAHGLTDALRDAELLARAVLPVLDEPDPDRGLAALAAYGADRDRLSVEHFAICDEVAGYDWTPDEARTLLKAMSRCMAEEVDEIAAFDADPAVRAA